MGCCDSRLILDRWSNCLPYRLRASRPARGQVKLRVGVSRAAIRMRRKRQTPLPAGKRVPPGLPDRQVLAEGAEVQQFDLLRNIAVPRGIRDPAGARGCGAVAAVAQPARQTRPVRPTRKPGNDGAKPSAGQPARCRGHTGAFTTQCPAERATTAPWPRSTRR